MHSPIYPASLWPLGHLYWMTLMCLSGRGTVPCLPRCVDLSFCVQLRARGWMWTSQPSKPSQPGFPWALHGRALFWTVNAKYRALDRHQQGAYHLERACCKPVTTLLEPFVQRLVLKHSHSMFSLTPLELVWIVSVSYHEKCPNSISLNPWFKSLPFHEILSI